MKIHILPSTEEAFKQSLYDNNINPGDLLIIPSEQVIGVCHLWPFSITKKHGWLEPLDSKESFQKKLIKSPQLIDAYNLYINTKKHDGIHIQSEPTRPEER